MERKIMIRQIILNFFAGILLLLPLVFLSSCTDGPGNGQDIPFSMFCFSKKMEDSLDELRKRPYPFDDWIARHGKRFFPDWDRESQLRWLTELFPLTDAGATYDLMEVARENNLLLAWDLHSMRLQPEKRKKLRHALGYYITQ